MRCPLWGPPSQWLDVLSKMQAKEYFSKPKTAIRVVKIIGNVIFYVVILTIIAFGIIGVLGRIQGTGNGLGIAGYNFYVVVSPSMSFVNPDNSRKIDIEALGNTQFNKGDLVVVRNLKPDEELYDLEVATYPMNGTIIIHRIVGSYTDSRGTTFYTTQGDANNGVDGDRTRDEFLGTFVSNWGKNAGTFVSFIQSGFGIAAIALTLGVLIAAWLVYDAVKDKKKPREPDDLPEDAA